MVVDAIGNKISNGAIDPVAAAQPLRKLIGQSGLRGQPEVFEALRLLGYDEESLQNGEEGILIARSAEDFFGLVGNQLHGLGHEQLHVATLTRYNGVIAKRLVYEGTVDSIQKLEPRDIFRDALLMGAEYVVMFHNHPSGNIQPSRLDRRTTKDMCRVGRTLGVEILDHIICHNDRAFSMRRARMLPKLRRRK